MGDAPCKSGLTGLCTRIEDAGGTLTLGMHLNTGCSRLLWQVWGMGAAFAISMDEKTDEIMG